MTTNDQPQTIPADKVRDLRDQYARLIEDAGTKEAQAYYGHVVDDLESLLPDPPRPTLADMTDEEREQHVTGQVDVNTKTFAGRGILVGFDALSRVTLKNAHAVILTRDWQSIVVNPKDVTPRPDLPRLEWPDTEKPAPTPALPGDWRLADHKDHGRVMVTTPTPGSGGNVFFVLPSDGPLGYDWFFCDPDELTYLDTGQGADTVPPNTLAVGSVWGDVDALARACRESGRDQIVITDKDGDVFVWGADAEWWEAGLPERSYAPFTILHAGKEADQ